jgi:phosphoglycolate phosphatase-like HAD superfamily hydrolase
MTHVPYETLLFDIDGTLIDSNGAHAQSWVDALPQHDVSAELAEVRRLIGMGGDKLLPTSRASMTTPSEVVRLRSRRSRYLLLCYRRCSRLEARDLFSRTFATVA